jgi:hypothetical protein
MAQISSTQNVDLKKILPIIGKDFQAIKQGFASLVKFKRDEGLGRVSASYKQRQDTYKTKFSPILKKKTNLKENVKETSNSLLSALGSIVGFLPSLLTFIGIAGLIKLILGAGAGSYIGKFIVNAFQSIVDILQKSYTVVRNLFLDTEIQQSFFKTIKKIFEFIATGLMASFAITKSLFTDNEVITKIVETIKSVFSAIFNSIGALYSIVSEIFTENRSSIVSGVGEFVKKIIDVIVPTLKIFAGSFKDLVTNEEFRTAFVNIAKNLVGVVVAAFNVEFTDDKGQRKSIALEVLKWVGEAALLVVAFAALKIAMFKFGLAVSAANFSKDTPCDCGLVGPDDLDRDGKKTGQKPKPQEGRGRIGQWWDDIQSKTKKVGEKIGGYIDEFKEGAKRIWGKVTDFGEKVLKRAVSLGERVIGFVKEKAQKYGKYIIAIVKDSKIYDKVLSLAISKLGPTVERLLARLALAGAGVATGGVLTVVFGVLSAIDMAIIFYGIYELLFVEGYYKEIEKMVEDWWKKDSTPTKQKDSAPPAPELKEPTAQTSTTSTTPMSVASTTSMPTTPTQTAQVSSPDLRPGESMTMGEGESRPYPVQSVPNEQRPQISPSVVSSDIQTRTVSGLGFGGVRRSTKGVIIHHTGGRGLDVAIRTLQSRKLAYHYLVDRDGKIVNILPDNLVGWHAGKTDKKPGLDNENTVSISMVAKDDSDVTPEQLAAAANLEDKLAKKYGFSKSEAYGHGEVSSAKHPKEGFTIASAIRGGRIDSVVESIASKASEGAKQFKTDVIEPVVSKGGEFLETASVELASGLRMLEDLFMGSARPTFTDLSTTINQSTTISRPGGNLQNREEKAIKYLIQRQVS